MGQLADKLIETYRNWSPGSAARIEEARRYMPGGDTRSSAHYAPYPVFVVEGSGCRLRDVDGHEYVDFMNNFTSLAHGHGHPPSVEAVNRQMAIGSAYAAPTESQVELARLLCERVPSVDEIRFCSSGSEATMMTMRAARAFTGRQKIMKIEGGYNGSHDIGEISLVPIPGKAGPLENPATLLTDRSLSENVAAGLVITPFNEPEITARQLEEQGGEVAALILEPMLGGMGMIPPDPGYLAVLREVTREHGVVLIFDEVITLRVAAGGMQDREGVVPDLTAMGKIIGGGIPAGAFGGRRDIMEMFNPHERKPVMHASTFSGNPLTMAAGLAAMQALPAAEIGRLNHLGDRLRHGFNEAFAGAGICGQATGIGSLCHVHMTDGPVRGARESVSASYTARHLPSLLHLGMLRRGIFPAGRQMYCTSTPMTETEIDLAIAAFAETLQEIRPVAEEDVPELLVREEIGA